MDAALYKTSPPIVTSLLALNVPQGPPLTVVWDDGSDSKLENVAAGSTAFLSGAKMYQCLGEEEKRLVENSSVEYAPWPCTFFFPLSPSFASAPRLSPLISSGERIADGSSLTANLRYRPMEWRFERQLERIGHLSRGRQSAAVGGFARVEEGGCEE